MNKLLVFLVFFLPLIALSQIGYSPTDLDARARAMGKTSIVSTTGSNGIFSNPAIIATLDTGQLQLGGRLAMGTHDDDSKTKDNGYEGYEENYTPHIALSQLSYCSPIEINNQDFKLVLGIGYGRYLDGGAKGEESYKSVSSGTKETYTWSSGGGLHTLSPSGAISYQGKYFLGLSINKSILSNITYEAEGKSVSTDGTTDKYTRTYDRNTSATFIQIGGLAKFTSEFRAGFIYRPEFVWEKDKYKVKKKHNGDETTYEYDKTKYTIPSIFGFGASYKFSPTLEVAAEYQTRNWSELKVDQEDISIKDGSAYRIGVEYVGPALFRFGYFSDAILATDEDDDVPKSLSGITGGIGFIKNNITLDVFFEISSWSQDVTRFDDKLYTIGDNFTTIGTSIKYVLEQ